MRKNKLKELYKAGKPIINTWLAVPSSFSAEIMANPKASFLSNFTILITLVSIGKKFNKVFFHFKFINTHYHPHITLLLRP